MKKQNPYNLDDQFSRLSTARIQNMITARLAKEAAASEDCTALEIKQDNAGTDYAWDFYQPKIDKLRAIQDDVNDWMIAARPLFSVVLWAELVNHDQCWTE